MLRHACALLVAATAVFGAAGGASAGTPFDGRWSVVVETERGSCDRAYRYGLLIQNGNVTTSASGSAFDIRGRVVRNGAVHVRVSRGASYADGHGRLGRENGSGVWKGVGDGVCSGHWFAERRG